MVIKPIPKALFVSKLSLLIMAVRMEVMEVTAMEMEVLEVSEATASSSLPMISM
jgi:hypothetical protein